MFENESERLLVAAVQDTTPAGMRRMDAAETQALLHQLRHVRSQTYDVKYPALRARTFIPADGSVNTGAETVTYRQYDVFGAAKIISNYADDLPRVDYLKREFTGSIKSLGDSYGYSIQDLRRAAMFGDSLDQRKSAQARRAIEVQIDQIAAFGVAKANLIGFTNNSTTPTVTLPNLGAWSALTPQQILENMNFLATSVRTLTKQVHTPDTQLYDSATFELISTTYIDTTNDKTIKTSFLDNNPYIRNLDQWNQLDLADTAGTGPRIVTYERTPENLQLVIPQEFEIFPAEKRNLEWVFNCHARIGGVEWHYPLSANYAEGHG